MTEVIAESVEFCESKQQPENDFAKTEAGYFDDIEQPAQQDQQDYFPLDDETVPF